MPISCPLRSHPAPPGGRGRARAAAAQASRPVCPGTRACHAEARPPSHRTCGPQTPKFLGLEARIPGRAGCEPCSTASLHGTRCPWHLVPDHQWFRAGRAHHKYSSGAPAVGVLHHFYSVRGHASTVDLSQLQRSAVCWSGAARAASPPGRGRQLHGHPARARACACQERGAACTFPSVSARGRCPSTRHHGRAAPTSLAFDAASVGGSADPWTHGGPRRER